ncbi:MAG: alpha-L-fucosidase [Cyclobacteriaceae bacterium]
MKKITTFIFFVSLALFCPEAVGQSTTGSESYRSGTVLEKRLEWFQDQKFGLFISFGIWGEGVFSTPWQLSLDHLAANKGKVPGWDYDINAYRNAYWNLSKVFYPYKFDAEEWARIAKDAGTKYFIFYTKHHDGFNMYDTRLSDYKITSPDCPYADHPNPDYSARLFEACRKEGLAVGACHSFSDWHSPFYWKPNSPAPDRYENYDADKEPERWQKFVDFFHGQIQELMTRYGRIDILWLDGGWSLHYNRQGQKGAGESMHVRMQDMQMDRLVDMARGYQPELIVVERGGARAGSKHENYKTPERRVPEEPLGEPWETWWAMGDDSSQELLHMLVDIVSKGGNLLLCPAVTAAGMIDPSCVERLKEMGEWLRINSDAIYGTRMYSRYRDGNVCYTKKGGHVYAIYLGQAQASKMRAGLPPRVIIKHVKPVAGSKIYLLGVNEPLKWRSVGDAIEITIPEPVTRSAPCKYAYSFRIQVSM